MKEKISQLCTKTAQYFDRYFYFFLGGLCLIYAGMEFFYVSRLPLVMDEFQGAGAVYALKSQIPYIDFLPYKTVLGYYIQLPPMLLPGDVWQKIMSVKYEMVLINAAAIFFAGTLLQAHFKKISIFAATLLLIFVTTFLERSCDVRVDMLTAWFGLFSLICVLNKRMVIGGLLLAASFLTSQKGVYFAGASAVALVSYWLLENRTWAQFKQMLIFGATAALPIILYFVLFGLFSKSVTSVTNQVVVANKHIAIENLYKDVKEFWFQTMGRNPLFYLGFLTSIGALVINRTRSYKEWILSLYAIVMLIGCLWHKQPWPYFFVLLIPTAWLCIMGLINIETKKNKTLSATTWLLIIGLGIAYPMAARFPKVLKQDNALQKHTIKLADHIIGPGDTYMAGMRMLLNAKQPYGFGWLDWKALGLKKKQNKAALIKTLKKSKMKLYVTSYRTNALPRQVKQYLHENYKTLRGNVNIYCPTIKSTGKRPKTAPSTATPSTTFDLFFTDHYILKSGSPIQIDGKTIKPNARVKLAAGKHTTNKGNFRLCLDPNGWRKVVPNNYKPSKLFHKPYRW